MNIDMIPENAIPNNKNGAISRQIDHISKTIEEVILIIEFSID